MRRPDFDRVRRLDDARARGVRPGYARNLRIAEALLADARALGVWPPADPLAGIDVKIRIAKAINTRVDPHPMSSRTDG